jgi:stage II sporulation protein D
MAVSRRGVARGGRARAGLTLAAPAVLAALAIAAGGCARVRPEPPSAPAERPAPARPAPPSTPIPAPPSPGAWRHARTVRVGLAVGAGQVLVAGSRDWELRREGGEAIAGERAGARLLLRRRGAGPLEVLREGGEKPLWFGGPGDTLTLLSEGGFAGWNGHWYRGSFRIHAGRPEGITLVNVVGVEDYLRSVLPNEIGTPRDGGYEAVKAQAVAARSYTLGYLGRRAALGFDLYASVEDQVYAGTTLENAQSDRALDETRGEVLVSGGAPIRALYSSACGGRTANVEDVWPWSWTPYLRSVRDADGSEATPWCSGSSSFRWREEWQVPEFLAMLRQYATATEGDRATLAGELLDARVRSRSRCGRVQEVVIVTTAGDLVLRGDRSRWALRRPGGSAILRSSLFKIGVARGGEGVPDRVVVTGAGNGHGIGLCQWGALGMSRSGKTYREILRHYYRATSLVRR